MQQIAGREQKGRCKLENKVTKNWLNSSTVCIRTWTEKENS
jgi:hypothetical protein